MAYILTRIKNWITPPAPVPPPAAPITPPPIPTVPDVKPSMIDAVSYLRAFAVLRNIDFDKLRNACAKLPVKQIGITVGILAWSGLSYWLCYLVIQLFTVN